MGRAIRTIWVLVRRHHCVIAESIYLPYIPIVDLFVYDVGDIKSATMTTVSDMDRAGEKHSIAFNWPQYRSIVPYLHVDANLYSGKSNVSRKAYSGSSPSDFSIFHSSQRLVRWPEVLRVHRLEFRADRRLPGRFAHYARLRRLQPGRRRRISRHSDHRVHARWIPALGCEGSRLDEADPELLGRLGGGLLGSWREGA